MGDSNVSDGPPPAKEDLAPIALDERCYRGDLELIQLYQSLSMGLLRASLTGIAVVGVLVTYFTYQAAETKSLLVATLVLLTVTIALALAHRWCLALGFRHHLKSLKCGQSATRRDEAAGERRRRGRYYKTAGYLLIGLCLTFLAGAVVLVLGFMSCIRTM